MITDQIWLQNAYLIAMQIAANTIIRLRLRKTPLPRGMLSFAPDGVSNGDSVRA